MIKGLMGDVYVNVSGGDTSLPYVSQNTSNPIQGMIRINGNLLEAFDGAKWIQINSSYATVSLTATYQTAMNWVVEKMGEEQRMKALAAQHPAIADQLAAVREAEEKLRMITLLVQT